MADNISPTGYKTDPTIMVTRHALNALYVTTAVIVVEQSCLKAVEKLLPEGVIDIVALSSEGILSIPHEEVSPNEELSELLGAPIGLKAIICPDSQAGHIARLSEALDKAQCFTPPQIFEVSRFNKRVLTSALMKTLADANTAELDRFSTVTLELAALRKEHERALNALEKAKRLQEVLSYSHAALTFEAPVGQVSDKLSRVTEDRISQHLPVDLTGLYAFELYLGSVDAAASDEMQCVLKRAADGKTVWQQSRPVKEMTEGWNLFQTELEDPDLFGEVILDVTVGDGNRLNLALSDIECSRFGILPDDQMAEKYDGKSLALKIWQGPSLPLKQISTDISSTQAGQRDVSLKVSKFSEMASNIQFLHGSEAHVAQFNAHGFWPLMVSEDLAYMQIHPLQDMTSAVILKGGAPSDMVRLGVEIRTAHSVAPPFRYIMMRLPRGADDKVAAVEQVIEAIGEQAVDGCTYYSGDADIYWSVRTLEAETQAVLELALPAPIGEPGDVVFAVVPATDMVSYGWCRWYSIYTETSRPYGATDS